MSTRRLAWSVTVITAGAVSLTAQQSAPPSLSWQALREGPRAGIVRELAETPGGVILADVSEVLHRSADDGRTWVPCRLIRPPMPTAFQTRPPSDTWFWHTIARSERGITPPSDVVDKFRVTDWSCESFGFLAMPATGAGFGQSGALFATAGANALVMTSGSVFVSPFPISPWTRTLTPPPSDGEWCAVGAGASAAVVVAGTRLYRSTDQGIIWALVPDDPAAAKGGTSRGNPGLTCPMVRSSNWSTLYSRGPGGLWRSTDNGDSWTRVFEQPFTSLTATEKRVWLYRFTPAEGHVLNRSDDEGRSWQTLRPPPRMTINRNVMIDTTRGTMLIGTGAGVYRSVDGGQSWTQTGFNEWDINLAAGRQRVYASNRAGTWVSADSGIAWERNSTALDGGAWTPEESLLQVFDIGEARLHAAASGRLLVSDDSGTTWRSAGLDRPVKSLVRVGPTWYAGTDNGVFSSPGTDTWTECSSGLRAGGLLVATPGGDLVDVVGGSRSINGCRSWQDLPTSGPPGRGPFVYGVPQNRVLSIGAGIHLLDLTTRQWTRLKDPEEMAVVSAARDSRGRYWLGTAHGVFVLASDGDEWNVWPMGFEGERIRSLAVDPKGFLLAAVDGRGLFRAVLP